MQLCGITNLLMLPLKFQAQRALNNCLVGNTTILAETAGEDHNLIQGFNSASNNATSNPSNTGKS